MIGNTQSLSLRSALDSVSSLASAEDSRSGLPNSSLLSPYSPNHDFVQSSSEPVPKRQQLIWAGPGQPSSLCWGLTFSSSLAGRVGQVTKVASETGGEVCWDICHWVLLPWLIIKRNHFGKCPPPPFFPLLALNLVAMPGAVAAICDQKATHIKTKSQLSEDGKSLVLCYNVQRLLQPWTATLRYAWWERNTHRYCLSYSSKHS